MLEFARPPPQLLTEFVTRLQGASSIVRGVNLIPPSTGVPLKSDWPEDTDILGQLRLFPEDASETFILLAIPVDEFNKCATVEDLFARMELRLRLGKNKPTSAVVFPPDCPMVILVGYFGQYPRVFEIQYRGYTIKSLCLVPDTVPIKQHKKYEGASVTYATPWLNGVAEHKTALIFSDTTEMAAVTFLCALHARLGQNSPARVLSRFTAEYIIELLYSLDKLKTTSFPIPVWKLYERLSGERLNLYYEMHGTVEAFIYPTISSKYLNTMGTGWRPPDVATADHHVEPVRLKLLLAREGSV